MQTENIRILVEDVKRVKEYAQSDGKTYWQFIHDLLNNINEVKAETQKVTNDSTLKTCLYDLYDWLTLPSGTFRTWDCPVRQKHPETTKEELAKIYCKNCPRKILTIMYKKAKMNPPKTESYKPYKKESTSSRFSYHELHDPSSPYYEYGDMKGGY